MQLTAVLLSEHSKACTLRIAQWVGHDSDRFADLWHLVRHGEPPLPARAAWAVEACAAEHAHLLLPHLPAIVQVFCEPGHHNAVHRNLGKALAGLPAIPEELQGLLYDTCLHRLADPSVHVAVQAHCMVMAAHIAAGIPELEDELRLVITEGMLHGSAAYKAKGKQVLKRLGR